MVHRTTFVLLFEEQELWCSGLGMRCLELKCINLFVFYYFVVCKDNIYIYFYYKIIWLNSFYFIFIPLLIIINKWLYRFNLYIIIIICSFIRLCTTTPHEVHSSLPSSHRRGWSSAPQLSPLFSSERLEHKGSAVVVRCYHNLI